MSYLWMLDGDIGNDEKNIAEQVLPADYAYQIIGFDLKERGEDLICVSV